MKALGAIAVLVTTVLCTAQEQSALPLSNVFQPGEELQYKVNWKFLRLGTIIVCTVQDSTCSGPTDIKVVMNVQSNPDLPFIWIREYNESLLNAVSVSSKSFRARHRNGDEYYAVKQVRDTARRTLAYTKTDLNTGAIVCCDTLQNIGDYVEGPSLFAYARCASRTVGTKRVPTVITGKMYSTDMSLDGTIEEVTIDALEEPVRARLLTGVAHWTGGSSAGMSGEFLGWMSDDDAAVPLKAEMQILLGSITLELESWTRPGWNAPTTKTASK